MYSLGTRDNHERQRLAEAALARRHSRENMSAARRDHFLLSCYGKTFDEMGESAVERRERDSDCAKMRPEVSTMLSEPDDPYGTVFHHTFRDRDEPKEIGASVMSASRYVPRAYYSGGGELNRARTAEIGRRREVVNSLEVRSATVSHCDVGARGRLRQPPYANPRYFLRAREQSRELGPPLRYGVRNELERVLQAQEYTSLTEPGEWTGNREIFDPRWRKNEPTKHAGPRFRGLSTPAENATHSVTGLNRDPTLDTLEAYTISRESSHAIKDSMEEFRHREPSLDTGGNWERVTSMHSLVSPVDKPASEKARLKVHASLRGLNPSASATLRARAYATSTRISSPNSRPFSTPI